MAFIFDSFVNSQMFPRPLPSTYRKPDLGEDLLMLPIKTNETHPCLWIKVDPRQMSKDVFLFCQGNAQDLKSNHEFLRELSSECKMDVLAIEYPGYGIAQGNPSEYSINRIVRAALEFLKDRYDAEHIVLLGRSIGSGPTCYAAELLKSKAKAVVLWSAYSSIKNLAKDFMGLVSS